MKKLSKLIWDFKRWVIRVQLNVHVNNAYWPARVEMRAYLFGRYKEGHYVPEDFPESIELREGTHEEIMREVQKLTERFCIHNVQIFCSPAASEVLLAKQKGDSHEEENSDRLRQHAE